MKVWRCVFVAAGLITLLGGPRTARADEWVGGNYRVIWQGRQEGMGNLRPIQEAGYGAVEAGAVGTIAGATSRYHISGVVIRTFTRVGNPPAVILGLGLRVVGSANVYPGSGGSARGTSFALPDEVSFPAAAGILGTASANGGTPGDSYDESNSSYPAAMRQGFLDSPSPAIDIYIAVVTADTNATNSGLMDAAGSNAFARASAVVVGPVVP
jgi:hypothetical protein